MLLFMAYTGEQKREHQRKWLQERRDAWIASQGGACVKCGSTLDLEIDHKEREDKSSPIATLWSRREEVRLKELIKCQILCRVCHREKTTVELRKPSPHGSTSTYAYRKCRCAKCCAAKKAYDAKYRSRKKENSAQGANRS